MTKEQYLKRLRGALVRKFSETEAADILEDYDGFFAVGESEGRTESEICEELGEPRELVKGLAAELGRKHRIGVALVRRVIFTLLLVALFYFLRSPDVVIALIIFTVADWLAGDRMEDAAGRAMTRALLIAGYVMPFAAIAATHTTLVNVEGLAQVWGAKAGLLIGIILVLLIFVCLIIAACGALRARRARECHAIAIHAVGAAIYLCGARYLLHGLDIYESFYRTVTGLLGVYSVLALLSLATLVILRRRGGRRG